MNRHKRTTNQGISDKGTLIKALKEIKIDKIPIVKVMKKYNIPRTSMFRYLKKINEQIPDFSQITDDELLEKIEQMISPGCRTLFTKEQEATLVTYLKESSRIYHGLSVNELKQLAYEFAKKTCVKYPVAWDKSQMAGKEWYGSFMKRNPSLILRTPEQISANRIKSFSKANVDAFFKLLDEVLTKTPYEPRNIWNMDETGFSTVPTKVGKIISEKGAKRVGIMSSAERGPLVTMALSVNAAGKSIPPFYIFPRKNMQQVFLEHATPGSMGVASQSGWMSQNEFNSWMRHFIDHSNSSKASPTLLLLDNHNSHLSIEALDMAIGNGVTILSFPPHCSHRMQPLDVAVYGPLKTFYKSQCNAWLKTNIGRLIEIRHIPSIVDKCLDLAVTSSNIKAGFRATGIFPYNPDIFTEQDFLAAELVSVSNEEVSTTDESSALQGTSSLSSFAESSSLLDSLREIGPLQKIAPKKKSNRGRKPQKSCVLTSPEKISELRCAQEKRSQQPSAKQPKSFAKQPKQAKEKSPPEEEDVELCFICKLSMPKRLNRFNSIHCNTCDVVAHLACVNMQGSYYTCSNCDSD